MRAWKTARRSRRAIGVTACWRTQAARAGGMAALGIARLGDEALLHAAGADVVVTSLDQVDIAATGASRARPDTETLADA